MVVVADTVLSTDRDKARRIILRLMVTVVIIVIIGNLITIFFFSVEDKLLIMT